MKPAGWLYPVNRWLEPLFCVAIATGLAWAIIHLITYSYIPQPYFYVAEDSWMDWINTAYWAHQPGAYDSWRTIYPPLSFVVLKVLTDPTCYAFAEGYTSRDCDWYGAVTLHLVYVLNFFLIWKTYRKIDPSTAPWRTFAMGAGLPMTFALERGNLVLLCFTCLLLAFGPLVRSARARWLFAGLAINFKVYVIGAVFAQLLRGRWRWFEGALLATVLVYLVTFAIIGSGTPVEIFRNIQDFAGMFESATPLDLWYTSTYKPVMSLLEAKSFPTTAVIGSWHVEFWSRALPIVLLLVQSCIVLAALAAALRPQVVPMFRLVFLSLSMALITSEAGGYTQIILLLFVFMERWRGFGRKLAIVIAYILCIPFDIPLTEVPPVAGLGFLGIREVVAEYDIGLMLFVRPALIQLMALTLSAVTLRDVWCAVRASGWAPGPHRPWRFHGSSRRPTAG